MSGPFSASPMKVKKQAESRLGNAKDSAIFRSNTNINYILCLVISELWISSLTLAVCFLGMYALIVKLTHTLPELAQCLGSSEGKCGREEVSD